MLGDTGGLIVRLLTALDELLETVGKVLRTFQINK